MANRMEAPADSTTQRLLDDLQNVVREAEELLSSGTAELDDLKSEARSKLTSALKGAKDTYANLQEKTVAGAKQADSYIRENPYQSLGIAFGVGVLLGVLVGRRTA
jgi:ElaB/YqjD/DUF883 family membrane-anchored ribosome-binding protein